MVERHAYIVKVILPVLSLVEVFETYYLNNLQEWRNGKRTWLRPKTLGVRISLPVRRSTSPIGRGDSLKRCSVQVRILGGVQISLWCNGNTQDFDSCIIGSSPIRLSNYSVYSVTARTRGKSSRIKFDP